MTPPPGSKEAKARGCPCPPQIELPWWVEAACPIHGWKEFQETP